MTPHHCKQTSLITILSSEHGRMRREQRDIDKRDLQKALKYGTRATCWGRRWRVEYDGIVFITDATMRREVTAFPAPLAFAEIDSNDQAAHNNAKYLIAQKPELCASHTVLVVDNSGSMTTHDINLHRDRQTAAYTTMALEFVAEQLFNGTANNSDVVSLVKFSDKARVVFTCEPVSWDLYNKLLSRRDAREFRTREAARALELIRCDSNYLPALEATERLLDSGFHQGCAVSVFFLSDGAPSDARELGITPAAAERRMCERIQKIASKFDSQLTITLVGFANSLLDFSVLKAMADAVNDTPTDVDARFVYCDKMPNAIGAALTSLVTSLTATRTTLMGTRSSGHTKRSIDPEEGMGTFSHWRYHRIDNHFVFDPSVNMFVPYPEHPPGALRDGNKVEAERHRRSTPRFLAISTKHCGKGAERVAFRCQLTDKTQPSGFVLGPMVAKETLSVERIEEHIG